MLNPSNLWNSQISSGWAKGYKIINTLEKIVLNILVILIHPRSLTRKIFFFVKARGFVIWSFPPKSDYFSSSPIISSFFMKFLPPKSKQPMINQYPANHHDRLTYAISRKYIINKVQSWIETLTSRVPP